MFVCWKISTIYIYIESFFFVSFFFFAELAVIDPPYGVTNAPWDKVGWKMFDFETCFRQINSASNNPLMSIVTFCAIQQYNDVVAAYRATGWQFPQFVVWHKKSKPADGGHGGVRFNNTCEYMVWAWKNSPVNGIFRYPAGSQLKKDLWIHPHICGEHQFKSSDDGKIVNPCQKPSELLERIIEYHSNPGGMILDLCAGSHALLFACLRKGRTCISVESDKRQHQAALAHWNVVMADMKEARQKEIRRQKVGSQKKGKKQKGKKKTKGKKRKRSSQADGGGAGGRRGGAEDQGASTSSHPEKLI